MKNVRRLISQTAGDNTSVVRRSPTRNKLYPAMLSIGVENFRFEVIEECDRSKLNEREDYWQDYFHAKDYGYR